MGKPGTAAGGKKLAPFNPKLKGSSEPRPTQRSGEAGDLDEPVLLQIQIKPRSRPAAAAEAQEVTGLSGSSKSAGPPPRGERRPRPKAERPRGKAPAERGPQSAKSDRTEPGGRTSARKESARERPHSRPAAPDRTPGGRPRERPHARQAAEDQPFATPPADRPSRPSSGKRPSRSPSARASTAQPERRSPKLPSLRVDRSSDRPSGGPAKARRPSGGRAREEGGSTGRPSERRSNDRTAGGSGSSDRPRTPASGRATEKRFDPNRPRDTRVGGKPEPQRRLTAQESFGLPKPWIAEIQEMARSGTAPRVAEAVSKALEHFAGEEFEEAAELAAQAKSYAPRSPRICELLGLSLYHLGRWKDALSELLTFRRLTASLEHNHVIADLYRALGRPDRALETAAEVSPSDVTPEVWVETMIVASGALADKGDFNRAITMLARADPGPGAVEPYFLRHWYARADLLERAGRRDEARNLWRRIVAEDPEFFDAEERLASV